MAPYYETFYPPFFMERRYAYNAIAVNPHGFDRPDTQIVRDLQLRFLMLSPLDTSRVKIVCHHNIVTLIGDVQNKAAVFFLGRIADRILGVRAVNNRLQAQRAGATARDDATNEHIIVPMNDMDPKPVDEFLL
jgi:hypothetical protein